MYEMGSVESMSPGEPKASRNLAGYRFFSVAAGSVRVPFQSEADTASIETHYTDVVKVKKTVRDLSAKNSLKASEEDDMKLTKGVVMNKHRIGMRLEGSSQDFVKFLRQLNNLFLNIEQINYGITYGDPKDKRRKPDVMELDFNILIPVRFLDDMRSDSSAAR
jgi:hypothetical protein